MNQSCSTIAGSLGRSVAQVNRLGSKVGHPALVLCSSDEPCELSQWQCCDDNTI